LTVFCARFTYKAWKQAKEEIEEKREEEEEGDKIEEFSD